MRKAFVILSLGLSFWMASAIGGATPAFAGKDDCPSCMDHVFDHEMGAALATQCGQGHRMHKECLEGQVKYTKFTSQKQAKKIQEKGLKCYGDGGGCKDRLPLSDVERLLQGTEALANFQTRLHSALTSCSGGDGSDSDSTSESSSRTDFHGNPSPSPRESEMSIKVREFRDKVLEAFNLCCPNVSCKGVLAPIEGCNAATCEGCQTKFCYLCLKPEADSASAHAHARAHSGDYWEQRDGHTGQVPEPGEKYQESEKYTVTETHPVHGKVIVEKEDPYKYTQRYHLQIVLEKLEGIFAGETSQEVREKAVVELEPILKKNKLWPLLFGKSTEEWIKQVKGEPSLDARNRIALFQNVSIYQKARAKKAQSEAVKTEASHRAKHIDEELKILKAPVLSSLDVGSAPAVQNHAILPLLEGHEDEGVRNLLAEVRRDKEAHPGENRLYDLGGADGRMYLIRDPNPNEQERVPSFVLSDAAPQKMNHGNAMAYCARIGARLPTKEELEALSRATRPGGQYNQNVIAGLAGTWLWSSSVHPNHDGYAFVFDGYNGNVNVYNRYYDYFRSVRCVR